MEKINRLQWEAGIAVEAFGVKLGIRVNTPAALEHLPDHLPPTWQPIHSSEVDHLSSIIWGGAPTRRGLRRYHILYSGAARIARTLEAEEMLQACSSVLDFQVAQRSPRRVFVHAGVVAWNNRALLIPGRSHSGKTTLVKALVEAGATYFSDEYAVLDGDGQVYPYPRPLNVRAAAGQKGTPLSVESMGGEVGGQPIKINWILDTQYVPEEAWRPRLLSASEAFLRLWDNILIAQRSPRQAAPVLRQVALNSCTLSGKRGEVHEMLDDIVAMMT